MIRALFRRQAGSADISGSMEVFSLNGNAVSISGDVSNTGTVTVTHPTGLIHMEVLGNGEWINEGLGNVSLMAVN